MSTEKLTGTLLGPLQKSEVRSGKKELGVVARSGNPSGAGGVLVGLRGNSGSGKRLRLVQCSNDLRAPAAWWSRRM